ncbi:aminopeptidase N-like isoform X3 [Hylaeus anthracinus]|uniref:aminopeptidase N-like isoform X3 n=1 Tax=Hylaeus anthracinus TaxID=313031 RepID=UPI0023BA3CEA|nr:aminopeptidase N-like isoform X3 [Hylaeus anthracinus]
MQVRTYWLRIAKYVGVQQRKTMRWIASIAGLFLILALPQNTEAFPRSQWKRTIGPHRLLFYNLREGTLLKTPTSYHLELEPFIGDNKYNGRVKVNVTWMDKSNVIALHVQPDLTITDCNVRIVEPSLEEREKGLPLMDVRVTHVEPPDSREPFFVFHLERMLEAGSSCEVSMSFTGSLATNETTGFFKREYVNFNGEKHPIVAMNFKDSHVRRVFPCMDEPFYKATFKLSVLRPKNMTALSSTPLEKSTEANGMPDLIWDHFEKTPQLSTYQLGLLVSDFVSISPTKEMNEMNGRKLEIKVWGPKENLEALKDVPDKVVKIMNYLQEYFNNSIISPKLDLVAVPSYGSARSDSWGLMLFEDSELSRPSLWNTAYELIYQWIGQYTTTSMWRDNRVKKALNSFLASMTTVDINPDEMEGKWPMTMLYSLYYEFGKTMPFSRVAGIRNEATSAKMELVLRMFNYTLGKELFQEGVRNFLGHEPKENPRLDFADDFYSILNDVANKTDNLPAGMTIDSIAGPWINRDRVPLVTAIRDYETKTIILNQKVYLREAPPASTARVSYQWDIPIVMMSQDKLEFHKPCPLWLTKADEPKNFTIPDIADENNFIIVNPEEIGIFPVNYDSCNWEMLSQFLQGPNREKIPVLTRAKLLHDSWNLAYAGELCFEIALDMTLFLKKERSHVVWEPMFMMIDHIGRRIEGSDVYPKFEAYIRSLLEPLCAELEETMQPTEPSWKTHMRGLTKNFLCRAGYEPCVAEARNRYKKWLTDEDPDKGNPVANEVLCPVFKWGTDAEWEFGLQRVINFPQNSPERKQNERTYLLKSLAGCPQDTNKIERLLNVTILDQNGNFTDSDIQLIFTMLTGGTAGYTTLFNFLNDHWDTVKERFKTKKHLWDGIINSATSSFNTQEGLDMVNDLYMDRNEEFDTAKHIIQDALIIIKEETKWSEKNLPVIDDWLTKNLPEEELLKICSKNKLNPGTNPPPPQ